MIMHGATNAEEYGKLVHWESYPDAEEWVRTRRQLLPGDGLLVLEVQDRLMKFLVVCCHQILHEIPPGVITKETGRVPSEGRLSGLSPSRETRRKRDLWELNKPFSRLFLDEPAQEPKKFKSEVKLKTKVKTKREQTEPATAAEVKPPAVEAKPEPEATQHIFAVDAKAPKVLRTLFFDPEIASTPGLIPWNGFLYAMAAAGFKIEKLYGSVWQFTPTKLDVERSIHFHEPHPMGKIPFEAARRHGR
ncbi:hypothetical protein J7337_007505 [Fusarium musae]|uniref:Uncharacterized protein n=1 Tax=Fusarium musae TaxID=1042133 RepID=A0A9P8DH11_9HYPO|nr:hypothetical protein J7337_007505 [Fusarium musae]KAG9501812.1 hypothetical protein J7337_007505 [Fusarium musae]